MSSMLALYSETSSTYLYFSLFDVNSPEVIPDEVSTSGKSDNVPPHVISEGKLPLPVAVPTFISDEVVRNVASA